MHGDHQHGKKIARNSRPIAFPCLQRQPQPQPQLLADTDTFSQVTEVEPPCDAKCKKNFFQKGAKEQFGIPSEGKALQKWSEGHCPLPKLVPGLWLLHEGQTSDLHRLDLLTQRAQDQSQVKDPDA